MEALCEESDGGVRREGDGVSLTFSLVSNYSCEY